MTQSNSKQKTDTKTPGRSSRLPAYHRLYVLLTESIRNGEYPPGTLLPSEKSLTQKYQMSRVTVRRALDQLVNDGIVSKHHGQGTLVNLDAFSSKPDDRITGLLSNLVGKNARFSSRTLSWGPIAPTKPVSEKLKLSLGETCILIRRVRYIENAPISYASIYLPQQIGEALQPLKDSDGLILELLEETNFAPQRMDFRVSAALADGEAAKMLNLLTGSAVLRMRGTAFTETGRPIYFQESYYHPDRYEYAGSYERSESADQAMIWKPMA